MRSLFLALSLCTCFHHHPCWGNLRQAKEKEFLDTVCRCSRAIRTLPRRGEGAVPQPLRTTAHRPHPGPNVSGQTAHPVLPPALSSPLFRSSPTQKNSGGGRRKEIASENILCLQGKGHRNQMLGSRKDLSTLSFLCYLGLLNQDKQFW